MTDRLERLGDPPPDWLTGEALEKARARRKARDGLTLGDGQKWTGREGQDPGEYEIASSDAEALTLRTAPEKSPLALPGVRFTEKQKQMIRDMPPIDEEGQVAELLERVICVHDELLGCTCYSDPCRCRELSSWSEVRDKIIAQDPPLAKLPPDAQPACRECNRHPCWCRELEAG